MENKNIRQAILDDRKAALLSKNNVKITALNAVWAEIEKSEKTGKRPAGSPEVDNTEAIVIMNRVNKQYAEALGYFEKAAATASEADKSGRIAKVQEIKACQEVLREYLPTQMSEDEIITALTAIIRTNGINGPSGVGKAMGLFVKTYPQKADGLVVKRLVDGLLSA